MFGSGPGDFHRAHPDDPDDIGEPARLRGVGKLGLRVGDAHRGDLARESVGG